MKRLVLPLCAALLSAGAAAQSVTMFGLVDLSLSRYEVSGGRKLNTLSHSSNNLSRLGFRGSEDLGGGLSASFWLEGALTPDDGNASGFSFMRRSTISLAGRWGELRLGRDFTPTYLNDGWFDPFNATGVGTSAVVLQRSSSNSRMPFALGVSANNAAYIRTSNGLGYHLPAGLGGFYGQVQYALHEQTTPGSRQGQYQGARLGYREQRLNIALAAGKVKGANPASAVAPDVTSVNLGASYDFGVLTLMGEYARDRYVTATATFTGSGWLLGLSAPVGPGAIKVSYSRAKIEGAGTPTAQVMALGYVYDLSKRSALYTSIARIRNSQGALVAVAPSVAGRIGDASSQGFDLGIRHQF
ncbi:MAG: porin [Burkholderiaceae bacterium]|nr:porin [Burkholderiaceae bacterium]